MRLKLNEKLGTRLCLLLLLFLSSQTLFAQWEEVAGLPGGAANARHHPVTFTIDNFGYIVTGSGTSSEFDNMFRYDAVSDSWTQMGDFPGGARSFSYGVSYEQYAFLGFGLGVDTDFSDVFYDDLWRYDSTTDSWEEMATCPCAGRLHPAFLAVGDKLFVGLGNNPSGNLDDWWEYDIPTNTWSQKDDFPGFARHHPYHFTIGDFAYVGLGHGNIGNPEVYRDFYRYDPDMEQWEQLGDLPAEGRVAGTQFNHDGYGYVLSGQGDDHFYLDTGEFFKYDPATDFWEEIDPHPGSGRWAPGSFVIENYVYLVAGLSIGLLESDMWRFRLADDVTSTSELDKAEQSVTLWYSEEQLKIEGWAEKNLTQALVVDYTGRPVMEIDNGLIETNELANGYYVLVSPTGAFQNEPFVITK